MLEPGTSPAHCSGVFPFLRAVFAGMMFPGQLIAFFGFREGRPWKVVRIFVARIG
ncbi:MAG: hypothetical protein QOF94_1255, partial [Acidobacteriaceae bacterium]